MKSLLLSTLLMSLSLSVSAFDPFDTVELLDKKCARAHGQNLCIGDSVTYENKISVDGGVKRFGWKVAAIVKANTGAGLITKERKVITTVVLKNDQGQEYLPSSKMKVEKDRLNLKVSDFSEKCHLGLCAGDVVYPGDTGSYAEIKYRVVGIHPKTKEVLTQSDDGLLYLSRLDQISK